MSLLFLLFLYVSRGLALQYRYFTEVCPIRPLRHKGYTSPEELYA